MRPWIRGKDTRRVGGSLRCKRPRSVRWAELRPAQGQSGGYLFIYYSDDISRLPVRFITKPGDNKADPNLETCSFGLFSTCGRSVRMGMVRRRYPFLFFLTRVRGERALAGYYRMRWYADGVFATAGDPCLVADHMHFVEAPPTCRSLGRIGKMDLTAPFRGCRLLDPDQCEILRERLEEQPDVTSSYLEEIDRLERFNLKHGGYRYIAWRQREKFSWDVAQKYLEDTPSEDHQAGKKNASPTGRWHCASCTYSFANVSLLKRCPACGAFATLRSLPG